MKTLLNIFLTSIAIFNATGCFRVTSDRDHRVAQEASAELPQDSIATVIKKKIQLIETVLNLPDVIKFSKLSITRQAHQDVNILLQEPVFKDTALDIIQDGNRLNVLRNLDSLDTSKHPVYVFSQMKIKGDSAFVQLIFDLTGMIAYGNLNYVGGSWVPDEEFRVAVR